MTRVFLSSPYSHPSPAVMEDRVRIAGDACAWLYHEGYLPMSPIVHWHQTSIRNGLPDNALAWTEWNRRWLEAADAIAFLHLDGWQDSTGMAMERQWAADKPQATLEPHEGSFRWVGAVAQERLLSAAHIERCPRCHHAGGIDDDDNGSPKCRFCAWRAAERNDVA